MSAPRRFLPGLALAGLLALAFGLRLWFFTGFVGSDDSAYLEAAKGIVQRGDWVARDLGSSRVLFVAVTAGTARLFGYGELATVAGPLLASLLTHIVVYWLARIYLGQIAALLAVFFLAFSPLNLTLSTILIPEPLLSLLLGAALLAYLLAERAAPVGAAVGSLSAGILLGLAYLVKEPAALVVLAFGIVWAFTALRERRIRTIWIAVGTGFALVFLSELVFRYMTTGSALQRFLIVSGSQAAGYEHSETARRLQPWYLNPRSMFLSIYQTGLLYYFLAASLGWAYGRGARVPPLLLGWLVVVLGYLTFGSASLTSYVPLAKQPRYLEAITVPAVLLTAGGVWQFLASGAPSAPKRAFVAIALAAYAVVGLACAQVTSALERWRFEPIRIVDRLLQANDLVPVYAPLRYTNGFAQLSGMRLNVDTSPAQTCTPLSEDALSVWAAPGVPGSERPPAPDAHCTGWTLWRTVEIKPSPLLSNTLAALQTALARAPMPGLFTRKIRSTIESHAVARTVRIFVPSHAPVASIRAVPPHPRPGRSFDGERR